jgi:hypothetical protein
MRPSVPPAPVFTPEEQELQAKVKREQRRAYKRAHYRKRLAMGMTPAEANHQPFR